MRKESGCREVAVPLGNTSSKRMRVDLPKSIHSHALRACIGSKMALSNQQFVKKMPSYQTPKRNYAVRRIAECVGKHMDALSNPSYVVNHPGYE